MGTERTEVAMVKQGGRMPLKQKLLIGLTAAAVVGGGTALVIVQPWKKPPPVAAREIAASLELVAGEVVLEGDSERRLLSGMPLPEGAKVRTGAGARALVRLADGSRAYVDENSRVEIAGGIVLHEGRAWLDAPALEEGQEAIAHAIGEATVSLSDGGASIEHRDGSISIYVAEGLAVVTGPGGRTEVAAGERVAIEGSEAPKVEPVAFWDDWTGGMADRAGLGNSRGVGSGALYAVDRNAPAGSPALPLQIQQQQVTVVMKDDLAETMVDQRFFNPSGRDVEGYYWFTIPEGSQLVGFALETNGQLVQGEIVERHEAAAKYEAAVQRANDPALLEWIDDRTVRARIFPVASLATRRVVVRYQQLLTEAEGKVRYTYPLAAPAGKDTASIEEFSLKVSLGDLGKQFDVATLSEARVEDAGQTVTMRRSGYTPRSDFELELTRKEGSKREPLRFDVLDPGGDQARYVMVRYAPDVDFETIEMPRGEVVVVVDTSAAGDPAEYQTRLAVAEAFLRSLSEGDRFAVMSADVRAEVLYPEEELAEAGPEAVSAALEKLTEHGTGGATDLGAVFEAALQRVHGAEQPAVIYIGDGLATSGERSGDALGERLRRSMSGSRARLFTVGVGESADERMLQMMARIGGGTSLQVDSPEQAVVRALQLSGALKTPTITDLHVDLGEGLDDVFTNATGKLSRGQEFVLLARTHHDLPKEVSVSGRLGGESFERTHALERHDGVLSQVVPRLWAGAYIERLLGDSRGPDAVRGKILSLGLEYGLMSPYTSFLALDSEAAYAQMGVQRRSRRFGGVQLTANEHRVVVEEKEERGVIEHVLVGALSAPIGCDSKGSAPMAEASPPSATANKPAMAKADESRNAAPQQQQGAMGGQAGNDDLAEAVAEEEAAKPEPAAPPPQPDPGVAGGGGEDGGMPVTVDAPAEVERSIEARRGGPTDTKKSMTGAPKGRMARKVPAPMHDGDVEEDEREKDVDKTPPRVTRPRMVSHVSRHRQLPCSDASVRTLSHRRVLWTKRLATAEAMAGALDSYEAAVGSCEVKGWKDQRTFLHLLQALAVTEADIGLLLAHFRDEPDAARYLARALMRRVVDPQLVAAVESGLFGDSVDWNDVDRRVRLEVEVDAKIEAVRDALARAPGDPQGELRLLELFVADKRLDEAVARGRTLREQAMMTPTLAQALGEVMVVHGREDEARRLFSEIVEFDPESVASRRLLGDIFYRHAWYDEAYRQYADLSELAAEDPSASIRLARAAAGAGRIDEALRVLRKIASGEGRPGADDPRRHARLHAAAYLAALLADKSGKSELPRESVVRELRKLQLFDGPSSWTFVVWEDLEAKLVLAHADATADGHLGDPIVAGDTGLYALQAPPTGFTSMIVRHAGELLARPVSYTVLTVTFDGKDFEVDKKTESLAARRSLLLEPLDAKPAEEDEETLADTTG
jgi:Ca-activated chloride channel family protein